MTITELNKKREAAERARASIKAQNDALGDVIGILEKAKVSKDAIDAVRPVLFAICNDLRGVNEQILQYGRLLEQISDNTSIAWPPACGQIPS